MPFLDLKRELTPLDNVKVDLIPLCDGRKLRSWKVLNGTHKKPIYDKEEWIDNAQEESYGQQVERHLRRIAATESSGAGKD